MGPVILLIDSNEETARETRELLAREGFGDVTIAPTVDEAAETAKTSPPEALLVHFNHPWAGEPGLPPGIAETPAVFISEDITPELASIIAGRPWYCHAALPLKSGMLAAAIDIALRRYSAGAALGEQAEKYHSFFNLTGDALFLIDNLTGQIIDCNQAASLIYGYSRDELLAMKNTDVSAEPEKTREATRTGAPLVPLRFHRKKDGTVFPVEITGSHFLWNDRNVHIAAIRDVTEARNAIQALNASEERLRLAVKATRDCIWDWDLANKTLWCNENFHALIGTPPRGEDIPNALLERIHPDDREKMRRQIESTLASAETFDHLYRIMTLQGDYIHVIDRGYVLRDGDGRPVRIVGAVIDIEDLKRKERELAASEESLRTLVDRSLQGTVILREGRIVYANRRAEEMSGYTAEELYRLTAGDLKRVIHYDDHPYVMPYLDGTLPPDETVQGLELRVYDRAGAIRWLECAVSSILFDGKPSLLLSIVDVSDRRKALAELKESEENYRTVVERANDLIVVIQDELIRYINHRASFLGYEPGEMLNTNFTRYVHRSSQKIMLSFYNLRMQNLYAPTIYEANLAHKDGSAVPVEVSGGVIQFGGEAADLAVIRDISDRKRLEASLRESEKRFREMVSMLPQVVYETDEKLNFTFVNRSGLELYGYELDDEINRVNVLNTVAPEDRERVAASVVKRLSGEQKGLVELTAVRKDGSTFPALSSPSPIMKDGKFAGIRGIIIDNTERKAAEESIRRSIEEKETLLTEVHHRVKNNLQLIASLLNLQSEKTVSEETVRALKQSHTRVMAMAKIHETLYQSETFADIDFKTYLNNIINDLAFLVTGSSSGAAIDLRAESVRLELSQAIPLGLIVNELVTNAMKYAFPDNRPFESRVITVSLSEKGGAVSLRIADNGAGLPGEVDPARAGSLGLNLVNILVKQLRGELRVASENGACFEISFEKRENGA